MKTYEYKKYGSLKNLLPVEANIPKPSENEILVKIKAAGVNQLDWHFLTGNPFMVRLMAGLFKPKNPRLGIDFAGIVESVGEGISKIQPGDPVYGSSGKGGAFAEYFCVNASEVQIKPSSLSFEQAAASGGAAYTALQALRDGGRIQTGQSVLINGASGAVGSFAVQIAKSFGAETTAVCSTKNKEFAKSIGADIVIDYTKEDFTKNGKEYDIVFDVAAKQNFSNCTQSLKSNGKFITTAFSPLLVIRSLFVSLEGSKRMVPFLAKAPTKEDQSQLKDLLESGKIKPVIDKKYPLENLPDALEHLSGGHSKGVIVINI